MLPLAMTPTLCKGIGVGRRLRAFFIRVVLLDAGPAALPTAIRVVTMASSSASHVLRHWDYLHSTNQGRLALSQRKSAIALLLLASSKLFPRPARFFLGNLQLALHLRDGSLGILLLGSHALQIGFSLEAQFALRVDLLCQLCLALLRLFLVLAVFVEPSLELALRRRAQALQLNHGMEEVCAGGGEIGNLPRQLLGQRLSANLIRVLLEPPYPVRGEAFPVRRESLPALESMRKV